MDKSNDIASNTSPEPKMEIDESNPTQAQNTNNVNINNVISPILREYFVAQSQVLMSNSSLADLLHDGTSGTVREWLVNEFLARHLPLHVEICNGMIWDSKGNKSGELDTIIMNPSAGLRLDLTGGSTKIALVEAVAAVVEIKSQLNDPELRDAIDTKFRKLHGLVDSSVSVMVQGREISRPIRIIFAPTTKSSLLHIQEQLSKYPKEHLPDLVCVLDHGAIISKEFYGGSQEQFTCITGQGVALALLCHILQTHFGALRARSWSLFSYIQGQWNTNPTATALYKQIESTFEVFQNVQNENNGVKGIILRQFLESTEIFLQSFNGDPRLKKILKWLHSAFRAYWRILQELTATMTSVGEESKLVKFAEQMAAIKIPKLTEENYVGAIRRVVHLHSLCTGVIAPDILLTKAQQLASFFASVAAK